jgi:glycolate oxidase iron-sulfur subunit
VVSVAYHAACHLAHAQNVRLAPQKLLEQMINDVNAQSSITRPGISLIPLVDPEHCCGSAGIFNLLHPQLSNQVLDAKMENLKDTAAACVVTSNPGCLLQLESGLRRRKMSMQVVHLTELLDQAYNLQNQDD